MPQDEHHLICANHGDCPAFGLVESLRKLRDRVRLYDNGRCEGEYFADEVNELLREHGYAIE